MPTTRRSRTIAGPPKRVWKTVGDPHHLPRWWPGVERIEGVNAGRFTQVHKTKKGRTVRLDFHVVRSEPPRVRVWEQEVVGTPFARVLSASVIDVRLDPDRSGTRVTIEQRQALRGYFRTGGFLVRRATGRSLDEALDGLERLYLPGGVAPGGGEQVS